MNIYYTPPPEKIFQEMKQISILLWSQYDDTYGYKSNKINRIKDLENIKDNFMYILSMFDLYNQNVIWHCASIQLKGEIQKRRNI